jgi:hypothetical protein
MLGLCFGGKIEKEDPILRLIGKALCRKSTEVTQNNVRGMIVFMAETLNLGAGLARWQPRTG